VEKELRIVSLSGKITLHWCHVDEEGYVEQVLDSPDLKFKTLEEMKRLIAAVQKAGNSAVTVVNSGNRRDLIRADLGEGD